MVVKKNNIQSPKKKPKGKDTSWHITWKAKVSNSAFLTLYLAVVSEREGRDWCLVAKMIYNDKLPNWSLSLVDVCINYKSMCLSAYMQWKLVNECTRISAVIVKCVLHLFYKSDYNHNKAFLDFPCIHV